MIEGFIESKVRPIIRQLREKNKGRVLSDNRLVHSFMFGVDDHQTVSPDNRLTHSDLGDLKESSDEPQ